MEKNTPALIALTGLLSACPKPALPEQGTALGIEYHYGSETSDGNGAYTQMRVDDRDPTKIPNFSRAASGLKESEVLTSLVATVRAVQDACDLPGAPIGELIHVTYDRPDCYDAWTAFERDTGVTSGLNESQADDLRSTFYQRCDSTFPPELTRAEVFYPLLDGENEACAAKVNPVGDCTIVPFGLMTSDLAPDDKPTRAFRVYCK